MFQNHKFTVRYIYTYVYVHVLLCTILLITIYVHMYVHTYLFIPTYIYKNIHAYMHTYIHQTSSSGPWPRKVELTCLHSKKPNYHESLHITTKPYCIELIVSIRSALNP